MDQTMLRIICGVLVLVFGAVLFLRRRSRNQE